MNPAILTAALTGPIATKADHPRLPVTPQEIAQAAVDAYDAGAAIAHVHLRDDDGRPTADVEVARQTIGLIEERSPILIQLSTGVGLSVPPEERMQIIEARPRMASLNVCSMTFAGGTFLNPPDVVRTMAERMRELDIRPELEIYDSGHLEVALQLHQEGLLVEPLQFSIVAGVRGGMPATPRALVSLVAELPQGATWQIIGIGRANRTLTAIGLAMGANARTGLEDTLLVRKGVPASGNAELVKGLSQIACALDREVATVEQAVQLLMLPR